MVKLTVTKKGTPKNLMRQFRQFMKEELQKALIFWREEIMPGHLKAGAGTKYKYRPRQRKYAERKRRRGLGPLQYSGSSMRQAMNDAKRPTGSSKRASLKISVGKYFNVNRKGWGNHTLGDELTKVTQKEADILLERVQSGVARRINAEKGFERMMLG